MAEGVEPLVLDAAALAAVAELWRNQGRELETSFGGASMLPSIRPTDVVRVACGASFAAGHVVVYVREDRIIVHRVIRTDDGLVWTGGDANLLPDPPVSVDQVLGRLTGIRTNAGWSELQTVPAGRFAAAVSRLPAWLINQLWQLRWMASRVGLAIWRLLRGAGSSRT